MNINDYFEKFLIDTVNLNKTRFDTARNGFETISLFLRNHDHLGKLFRDTRPQGSFRQKTIIKPATIDDEFDVDLLFQMTKVDDWEPKDYLQNIEKAFQDSDRYKDMVVTAGKSRCVTIDYADDFHIDVVPSIESGSQQFIMNRKDNEYEMTDGDGYAKWFQDADSFADGNLKLVVRLLKYLRDVKSTFSAKSVVLTTLLGRMVEGSDRSDYIDVPSSFAYLYLRLNQWLQDNESMPEIKNPVLPSETFNRHWDQTKYENFRNKIATSAELVEAAIAETDTESAVDKWQDVFGSDFPSAESKAKALAMQEAAVATYPFSIGDTSHCEPPPWESQITFKAHLDGYLYDRSGNKKFRGIRSGTKIPSDLAIKFVCSTTTPAPYNVKWQVVNTGRHAADRDQLRGGFFEAKDLENRKMRNQHINWEISEFTGSHWIEGFIIKAGAIVARTGKFVVNIKNPQR